ncbi:protein of unknown function UPF0047 [Alkalidesulfovibrio alkalitolerans DSM 16529]|uniref:Secondary thiamine-phosphate synthase enzyme n=1 Tax=Alkalidesulfovibrio alkalitolerans DSM 16529 TaxID=1121439 RepID=S7T1K5_9BACT|nr:secondary thiamine-phosphate synthase enzyme YjbQ [Alkalidesulfovibrio alkalitolerans]EPR30957.1 protein of unknown function UPF0047 [Alkalidesulfovibrio alkalitolerans DSM 16529]
MYSFSVATTAREQMADITREAAAALAALGGRNGALLLFSPHTTCGLTINEGADPSVQRDMIVALKRLIPLHGDYLHAEGNSDAHLKTTLTGTSLLVIVEDGAIKLGTWQRIFLCEYDGPRRRTVWAQFLPAQD